MNHEELSQTVEILVPKDLIGSVEGVLGTATGLQTEKAPPSRDSSIAVEILAVTAHSIVIIAELMRLREHFSNKVPGGESITVRNLDGSELRLKDATEKSLNALIASEGVKSGGSDAV